MANNAATASVTSNAPITLRRSVQITWGTVRVPVGSGSAMRDLVGMGHPVSPADFDAILAGPGLDPRAAAALSALRGAAPANQGNLAPFLGTATGPVAGVLGRQPFKSAPRVNVTFDSIAAANQKLVTAATGSVRYEACAPVDPLAFDFPALTPPSSGPNRDGRVVISLAVRDAEVLGPSATITTLVVHPVAPARQDRRRSDRRRRRAARRPRGRSQRYGSRREDRPRRDRPPARRALSLIRRARRNGHASRRPIRPRPRVPPGTLAPR